MKLSLSRDFDYSQYIAIRSYLRNVNGLRFSWPEFWSAIHDIDTALTMGGEMGQ